MRTSGFQVGTRAAHRTLREEADSVVDDMAGVLSTAEELQPSMTREALDDARLLHYPPEVPPDW